MNIKKYRPIIFILSTFTLTWFCWTVTSIELIDSRGSRILEVLLNATSFLASFAPTLVALILLGKKLLFKEKYIIPFFFGTKQPVIHYLIVALYFVSHFFMFYVNKTDHPPFNVTSFLGTFLVQLMLGGGLEEGGWRGYLLPAIGKRLPLIPAALLTIFVWYLWHLVLFVLPGNIHTGGNIIMYLVTITFTGLILTTIYKLTNSVLLCMLFHGFENALVVSFPPTMPIGMLIWMLFELSVAFVILFKYSKSSKPNCHDCKVQR